MGKKDLKTEQKLAPLFRTQATPAIMPSARAKSLHIDGIFTPAGQGESTETTLADYQDIAFIVDIKWALKPGKRAYSPDTDYTDTINRQTILMPPETVTKIPEIMPATLIILNDGQSLLTWRDRHHLCNQIQMTEKSALHTLEKLDHASGSYLAQQTISETLDFRATNADHLHNITNITLRSFRDIHSITKLEWKKEHNGQYSPAHHYADDLHTGTMLDPAFMPNDDTEHLPPALITLRNSARFLSWDDPDDITDRLERAQKEATSKLAVFIQNFAPTTQPQAQPAPKSKPNNDVKTFAPDE